VICFSTTLVIASTPAEVDNRATIFNRESLCQPALWLIMLSPAADLPSTHDHNVAREAKPGVPLSTASAPAIEAASEAAGDDEFDATSELFEDGTTSVTSSIYAHTYERGRRYQSFKNGRYPIPNDDVEQNREDMKHAMLMELTDGRLFYAPIGDNPQKIFDIGTGTGESPSQGPSGSLISN
jgi:hypothetical protein